VSRPALAALVAFLALALAGLGVLLPTLAWENQRLAAQELARARQALGELSRLPASWDLATLRSQVRRWGELSGLRLSVIAADGTVLADPEVPPEALERVENHRERPEVKAALQLGEGEAVRRSVTTGEVYRYLARKGWWGEQVVVVRWAIPSSRLPFPWFSLLSLLAVALVGAWGAFRLVGRWQEEVRGELESWTALPRGSDARAVAREADRLFRSQREALGRELAAAQRALELVREGVVLLDAEKVVRFANPAAAELLGSLERGKPLWEQLRLPELGELLTIPLAPGERRHGEVQHRGRKLAVAVQGLEHPLLRTAVVLQDLTPELQFAAARRAFVADLAHELRTPVTVLGGVAEELASQQADPALLEMLRRQVQRLSRFARDLEELARVETGTLELVLEPVELLRLAREVAADLEPFARERQVKLAVEGEPVTVVSDRLRLAQVLTNLLDNAVRYNRPQGSVTVTVTPRPEGALLGVKDTGLGIPENEIPLVFQRFYRVRRGEGEGAGSGLGLALVKHLLARLGGTITLRSRLGEGTEVEVTLPSQAPPAAT